MSRMMCTRASSLLGIDDEYCAWCLDEAVAMIINSLEHKRKLRPKQVGDDNSELIERYMKGR